MAQPRKRYQRSGSRLPAPRPERRLTGPLVPAPPERCPTRLPGDRPHRDCARSRAPFGRGRARLLLKPNSPPSEAHEPLIWLHARARTRSPAQIRDSRFVVERRMRAVSSACEDQRLAFAVLSPDYPADEDEMIAAFDRRFGTAFEDSQALLESRASTNLRCEFDLLELVVPRRREMARYGALLG